MVKKTKAAKKKQETAVTPLTRFLDKMLRKKCLQQSAIARAGVRLPTDLVNHVFQGRNESIPTLKRVATAMELDSFERQQLKRVWTETKWGESFSGGIEIPQTLLDRLDEMDRRFLSMTQVLREEEGHLMRQGKAESVAKFIASFALPAVNETAQALDELHGDLAVLKEKLVRKLHELEHPSIRHSEVDPLDVEVTISKELGDLG